MTPDLRHYLLRNFRLLQQNNDAIVERALRVNEWLDKAYAQVAFGDVHTAPDVISPSAVSEYEKWLAEFKKGRKL